jgi:regulator of protease activity HflC (stomatin/prohibitin superfamily)
MFMMEFLATHPLLVLIAVVIIALLLKSLRVANQYERSVVFQLGKFTVRRGRACTSSGRLSNG